MQTFQHLAETIVRAHNFGVKNRFMVAYSCITYYQRVKTFYAVGLGSFNRPTAGNLYNAP